MQGCLQIAQASVDIRCALERLKINEWERMIDVNIKGVLYGIAAALLCMKEQKSGHIINVSSVYGNVVDLSATVYYATKFEVRTLSEGLRNEVKALRYRDLSGRGPHRTPGARQREATANPSPSSPSPFNWYPAFSKTSSSKPCRPIAGL